MDDKTAAALRDLLVKERLHELEMAYCRGIDRRDPELIRSIYFDDCVEDHGEAWQGTGSEWVDYIFSGYLLQFEVTAHYVMNEWYKVDGERAQGETHRVSYHRRPNGEEVSAGSRTFNRYECRNGVWKIAYRGVTRDWLLESKAAPPDPAQPKHMILRPSLPGPQDVSYAELSMFGRGPID
ncbi:MAG: nuclear transport factor 2 family protein [Rhizobiaceae bacterium]|nr:nuclear transport factor 2 family protein [Rhizobiaceae bacterium]MCV0404938.1 nuclear transport factor 2 family protein [Rhizobiaceae bacterium]